MLYSKLSKACLGTTLSIALVMPCYALNVTSAAQAKGFALAPSATYKNAQVTNAALARYKMAGFNNIVTGKGAAPRSITTLRRVSTAKTTAPAAAVPAAGKAAPGAVTAPAKAVSATAAVGKAGAFRTGILGFKKR